MTYAEALAYIDALASPPTGRPAGPPELASSHSGPRPRRPYEGVKLARMRALLARLGDPQRGLRCVLIAGTKGKGSTAAMLSEILRAAGWRVGLTVKPHLMDYRERIQVDGRMVSRADLVRLVEAVRPAVDAGRDEAWGPATYVEASVAMAFRHFARSDVDIAVVEVGIGGRLDATNTAEPLVSVITPISYDHTELLGSTLREIAGEKAGIIRPEGQVVSASQPSDALDVIEAACRTQRARLVLAGRDVTVEMHASALSGIRATIRGLRGTYDVAIPLLGRHQAQNAAAAVAAAELVSPHGRTVGPAAVRAGLARVRWPARVELVGRHPTAIVDVGHNAASAEALRAALDELLGGRRLVLVFGMLATKDYRGVAAVIAPAAAEVVTTTPDNPHALPAEALAAEVRRHTPRVTAIADRGAALDHAWALAGPDDVLVVTGSFYLVGEAREWLRRRKAPEPARR